MQNSLKEKIINSPPIGAHGLFEVKFALYLYLHKSGNVDIYRSEGFLYSLW